MEEWRDIVNFPNYQVSNLGNVKNCKTNTMIKTSLGTKDKRYYYVSIYNEKNCRLLLHRIIAKAFIPTDDDSLEIDHKDRNTHNNNIENLRWATKSENKRNAYKKKLQTSSKYVGVCYRKSSDKWHSSIRINGKKKFIGSYETEEEAGLAYNNAIISHNLQDFAILNNI